MQPIRIISTQDSSTLHVRFNPTDICNFSCSYCFPGSGNVNKYRYPKNIDTVVKNFRLMFDNYEKKLKKTRFHLIIAGGGEPTMWPYLEQFCKEIKEQHNVFLTLITNGSRTVRWWKDNLAYFDDVVLSTHQEFVDIEHHCEVGDLLYEADVSVTALMLMDARHWDKCVAMVERMKKSNRPWSIEAKAVVEAPGMGMDVYTPEQLEYLAIGLKRLPDSDWILKRISTIRIHESIALFEDDSTKVNLPPDVIVNKWNYFKGWKCNVALETLLVRSDGAVTGSCLEPIFEGNMFNMFAEDFSEKFNLNVDFKPIICSRDCCSCQPETHVSKINLNAK